MMNINGKTAIITGAASGLGLATAQHFKTLGATVVMLDIQQDKLQKQAETLGFSYYVCDITDNSQTERTVKTIFDDGYTPSILVNCAGVAPGARIVGRDGPMDLAKFEKVIQINLIGSFNMMGLVAAKMMEGDPDVETKERGVIINTASVAAFEGQIGQVAYAASKAAVAGMTLPAAREFSKFGIRVMTIAPGLMETPMLTGMPEEVYENLVSTTLFPHRLGEPSEYAQLVHSIVENPLLNGETIRLDGAVRLAPK